MLLSNIAGIYLGDPALEPLLAELDRRGAYVFVHPGFPPHELPLEHPVWLYEFPFDTVRALTNLVYTGALERHRDIRFQVAHLGGAAPMLAHRLASLADREPELARQSPAGAVEYLRRLYYDTGLADNAPALAATLELTSLDHVVFGTDWPYLALPEGDDPAPGLAWLGDARAGVDGDQCRRAGARGRRPDARVRAGDPPTAAAPQPRVLRPCARGRRRGLREQGFDGFTLQEVSRRAAVSIGSIYARAPSKDALILAIYDREMERIGERQQQIEADSHREGPDGPRARGDARARHGRADALRERHPARVHAARGDRRR